MRDDISSKSLGTATELLVLADLKKDFVPIRDSITYATRMHILLRTLNALRKAGLEQESNTIYVGPIDRLQTIYHVRWTLIDENQRMLLAVVFDSPLEPYVRRVVDIAGPVLDAILCHCEGYVGHTCWEGHDGFAKWVADRQIDVDMYGSSAPHLTVEDLTYLTDLEKLQRSHTDLREFDRQAALLKVDPPAEKVRIALEKFPHDAQEQAFKLLRAMYRLREYFPEEIVAPAGNTEVVASDAFYLKRLTKSLVAGFDSHGLSRRETRAYQKEIDWFRTFEHVDLIAEVVAPHIGKKKSKKKSVGISLPNECDIQGGIISGYGQTTYGYLLLMRFGDQDGARTFLRKHKSEFAASYTDPDGIYANVALSYDGLGRLGLHEATLRRFPKEFRDGMEARAGMLGDLGVNHPRNWTLPQHNESGHDVRLSSVDMVVQLQAASRGSDQGKTALDRSLERWRARAKTHNVEILVIDPLQRRADPDDPRYSREHFGFRDGISQPVVRTAESETNGQDAVALGEILLGYPNDRDNFPLPRNGGEPVDRLFDNSSFLVVRKLRQNVRAFNAFLNKANGAVDRETLAAKMMGRYMNGDPLVPEHIRHRIGPDGNDFDFSEDPSGAICPFHAHTRRANPRPSQADLGGDQPTPKIMRRGFSYGPRYSPDTADEDRGIFFMAYNASIAEQFEVIQSWLNGGNSSGVYSQQNDAVLGVRQPGDTRTFRFIHNGGIHRFDTPDAPFVTLQWGLYLFAPSIAALELLSGVDEDIPQATDNPVERGAKTVAKLQLLHEQYRVQYSDPAEVQHHITLAWKALLEDPSGEDLAEEVWAYIRATGGVYKSPAGVLVCSYDAVKHVFKDDGSTYSTREYWHRMRQSIGALFLGYDKCPVKIPSGDNPEAAARNRKFENEVPQGLYESLAYPINNWIADIGEEAAFDQAAVLARHWFDSRLPGKDDPVTVELKDFAADIVGQLSVDWFGLPDNGSILIGSETGEKPNTPDDLVSASYYLFGPHPTETVIAQGQMRGMLLSQEVRRFVEKHCDDNGATLRHYLNGTKPFSGDTDLIVRMMVGCTNGFVAATRGSFLSVIRRWISDETLWHLRHGILEDQPNPPDISYAVAKAKLRRELILAMQKRARPNLLHRTATKETQLGAVKIAANDRVILSLQSAATEQPGDPEILFGGNYGAKDTTLHACSGQTMALGVLLGMFTAIMEQPILEPDGVFSLSLAKPK